MDRKSKLYIEMDGVRANAEIAGTSAEIIFNWTALTNQICLKLHLNPVRLAFMLPMLIDNYKQTLRESVEVDAVAMKQQRKGDQP